MLRIIQNRSPASAASYYSHAEYYGEGQEKAGIWGGKTAEMLGLEGRIQESDFQALCNNLDPRTGQQLTARHDANRRTVGYDFNWHVPKGVTLAYAVGGDKRIEAIVERSVHETMLEMESEAKTRVRIGGKQEDRTTGNLVWGQFLHTTTRPDDKGAVDPHLHIHCFVFNVTHDSKEDRFKAAQFRQLKQDASFFEARMHARLAKALRNELGYSIERDGRHWDIAGFSKATKKKFSRRTTEIEQLAKEEGITSPEKKAELGARTRNTKAGHESFATLQTAWRARLDPEETRQFKHLTSSGKKVNGPATTVEAVQQALLHCFERESVVPERNVLAEALRMGVGTVDVHEVAAEARRQRLLTREHEGRRISSLPEVLADETAVLKFARDSRGAVEPLNPRWTPEVSWLSEEQINAIRQLTHSHDRMQLVLGGAGTGKTTLMSQAVAAMEAGGHKVFTFAPSADASRKVLRDEGFANATTVAELLVNEKLQKEIRNSVIWIDEASLLGTRQLRKVVDLAEKSNARLILSGDWKRQHGSVQRGGVLGLLDRYAGITPIQIETIRRQHGEYKEAIAAMASGHLQRGFDQLDKLGWVHELDDDVRDRRIASDYADTVMAGKSALVVSPTHREAEHLCCAIRATLRERGTITGDDHEVQTLLPLHLTEGERHDPAFLREGDVMIFNQNARGIRKGERFTVGQNVPKSLTDQAERYSVYRPSTMKLACGDKIRMTAGGETKDGKHRLNNGAVYQVAEISKAGDITLSNGWVIDAAFGHISQGFVSTSHASQGRTVDHTFIAVSAESFGAAGREQMYVSASRGRHSAHIYTNNKAELREVILDSAAKMTATELFQPSKQYELYRKQQQAARVPMPEKQKVKELALEY